MTTPLPSHVHEYAGLPDLDLADWLGRSARLVEALRMGEPKARILALLRSDDASLRNGAVEALQAMPEAVRPLLPGLLADGDADVRILAVAPQVDREGKMMVAITIIARRFQDLDNFADRLQDSGAFTEVISRQDENLDDGTFRAVLQGYYTPVPRKPAEGSSAPPAEPTGDGR